MEGFPSKSFRKKASLSTHTEEAEERISTGNMVSKNEMAGDHKLTSRL